MSQAPFFLSALLSPVGFVIRLFTSGLNADGNVQFIYLQATNQSLLFAAVLSKLQTHLDFIRALKQPLKKAMAANLRHSAPHRSKSGQKETW